MYTALLWRSYIFLFISFLDLFCPFKVTLFRWLVLHKKKMLFQERVSLRKLATEKRKVQVIPNFDQFLALKYAAHQLDRLPSEQDQHWVWGPDYLLDNLLNPSGREFDFYKLHGQKAVINELTCGSSTMGKGRDFELSR